MKQFIKDLKKRGGHVLRKVQTYDNKLLLYYREFGSYPTDVKTKVFNKP